MALLDVTSATELQEAYDASPDGQILVDGTRGAVQVRDASTSIEDDIFSVLDSAGNPLARLSTSTSEPGLFLDTDLLPEPGTTDREVGQLGSISTFRALKARQLAGVRVEGSADEDNVLFTDVGGSPVGGVIAGRIDAAAGTLELGGGYYSPVAVLGSASAPSGNVGRLVNRGGGSLVMGSAFASGNIVSQTSEILATTSAYGCFVGGYTVALGAGADCRVRADATYGALVWGYASGNSGTNLVAAESGSHGSLVSGRAAGSGTNTLRAFNSPGSIVLGLASGTGTNLVESYGAEGALVHGSATTGNSIRVTADGGLAHGITAGFDILASGIGAGAFGRADSSDIVASASNAFQFGPGTNANADSLQVGSGVLLEASGDVTIGGALNHDGASLGFFGTAPAAKPTVTGSRGGNAALASLLTELAGLGLITDSTSA